jgi:Protein of unknown function (DUF2510)
VPNVTDITPAESASPKRTTSAKTPVAPARAAKVPPATGPAAKASTAKAPVAKAPVTKAPVTKAPVTKAQVTKAPVAKTPVTKTERSADVVTSPPARPRLAKKPTPAVAPVEAAPVVAAAPVTNSTSASAPAGWYPVTAGSAQQRWWDGSAWTDHVHDPMTARTAAAIAPEVLRAPAGARPDTVWFWLLAIGAPVLQILYLIPLSIYLSQLFSGDPTNASAMMANEFSPAALIVGLAGWFVYAVCIVFAALDWRELTSRGIPKPFHWAWAFSVIIVGWPGLYMIGRTVIARRRTGGGLAPLWVYVGLQVLAFVVVAIVVIVAIVQFVALIAGGVSNAGNVF